jgi:NADH:ubiquinone oxidoreductase subunit C
MDIKERIKERLEGKIRDWQEPSPRRIYFSVEKEDILEVARALFKEIGCRFSTASGVPTPEGFEIIYHFSFDQRGQVFSARVILKEEKQPEIDSISPIFPGAEWVEREIWEMLGINFKGHPNLKRLLLADDWPEGDYPLRQENS